MPRGAWQLEKEEKAEKHKKKSIKIESYFCHHYQVLLVNVLAETESRVVDRPAVGTYRCDKNENNVATMEVSISKSERFGEAP